jgi:hypothetical protein
VRFETIEEDPNLTTFETSAKDRKTATFWCSETLLENQSKTALSHTGFAGGKGVPKPVIFRKRSVGAGPKTASNSLVAACNAFPYF